MSLIRCRRSGEFESHESTVNSAFVIPAVSRMRASMAAGSQLNTAENASQAWDSSGFSAEGDPLFMTSPYLTRKVNDEILSDVIVSGLVN